MTTAVQPRDPEVIFRLLPPIFRRCVYETEKYNLTSPFVIGDHIYGTDGRMAVRLFVGPTLVETAKIIDDCRAEDNRCPPGIVEFFSELFEAEGIPVPDLSAAPKCAECEGTGTVHGLYCGDCGCLTKHPAVTSECNDCEGSGLGERGDKGMIVGGKVRLAYKYLKPLADAHATLHLPLGDDHGTKTRFVCPDGVEGVVMPLKWEA